MGRNKIKEIELTDMVYQADISVLVGGDVNDLISFIKSRHGDSKTYSWDAEFEWTFDADTTNAYQFHINYPLSKGERFYIWVSEATPYLIAHELYHLTGDILFTRGVGYVYESEEAFAYHFSHIFEIVFNKLKWKTN